MEGEDEEQNQGKEIGEGEERERGGKNCDWRNEFILNSLIVFSYTPSIYRVVILGLGCNYVKVLRLACNCVFTKYLYLGHVG